ncbi:hypothetical protein [Nannocystis pusilla]|uniref:hypothetical protein n=1 Tax=Nannocystis pusilla TaxID=889268 RepID=UPI003DA2661B
MFDALDRLELADPGDQRVALGRRGAQRIVRLGRLLRDRGPARLGRGRRGQRTEARRHAHECDHEAAMRDGHANLRD